MKKIFLPRGYFALVDDEDFETLNKFRWLANVKGDYWYVFKRRYLRTENKKEISEFTYMHRYITKAKKGQYVDHKNGLTYDNRKCNLRVCTAAQNCMNGRLRIDNTSGFRGVYLNKNRKKFVAQISLKGKATSLGLFKTKELAAKAYNEAAKKYFGEFARLNVVSE